MSNTTNSGVTSANTAAKKSSVSEVGHAKNIANLNLLNTHIAALGALYNPSNNALRLDNLQALYDTANAHHQAVNNLTAPYALAVDAREALFRTLNPNLTRLRRAYKATEGVGPAQLEDFMTIVRKLKGKTTKTSAAAPDANTHSNSQMSYDQRTNHLDLLIALLQNTPGFGPNEAEFTAAAYQDLKTDMHARTQAVANTYVPLNMARGTRNQTLYLNSDNLVDTANKAKDYLATILPKTSPQYKAIAALKFSKAKL